MESASAINSHFLDIGIFGIKMEGLKGNEDEMLKIIIRELKKLGDGSLSQVEFERGRNCLLSNILLGLERAAGRLEETCKNIFTFERIRSYSYSELLMSV